MIPTQTINAPRLAGREEAEQLFDLLCAARCEIGLAERVCDPAYRAKYVNEFQRYCDEKYLWVVGPAAGIKAMLVLKPCPWDTWEVFYVVVSKQERRCGVGSALVRHVQTLEGMVELRAEARNEGSRRMLEGCGFVTTGEVKGGFPILEWRR